MISIYNIPSNKISVVLLGFDVFNKIEDNACEIKKNEKPFLLYVGSRAGYKNFSGLLKSVAQSNKLKKEFDIIAFGGGDFTADELKFINKLDFMENQVRQVNGDDILLGQYFRSARAFVYPSLYEGFGIPPLESMAHRCPVISSNTSSMPEVIGQAAEFFNPYCSDEVRNAIESVVFSDQRSAELIDLGENRLVDFSWAKCAKETLSVYKNLN